MMPLVSIIVPCYNQAQYLPETLDSVLAQTYPNWECIIVNDGSPDNTEEIAKQYCNKDERFKYLWQRNSGVSVARNNGIALSKGDFLQFIDSDDVLELDKLNQQVGFLIENEHVDIVYSGSRYFYNTDKGKDFFAIHPKGIVPTIEMTYKDENQKEILSIRNICTICASLYRRKVVEFLRFKSIVFEDWLFHFECALLGFTFHFENFENSKSLIRLTSNSQMLRHINQSRVENIFKDEFDNLALKYDFKTKFKNNTSDNIMESSEQIVKRKSYVKETILKITPPIIIIIQKIKRIISHD